MTRNFVERTVSPDHLASAVGDLLGAGHRLALAAAHDDGHQLRIVYVLLASAPDRRVEISVCLPTDDPRVPTLARLSYPAGRFEREMHDLFGIVPVDHPLPRRLVRHWHWPAGWYPMRADAGDSPGFTDVEPYPFLTVEGPGVYEIPVGPIHAGLIEPGHFRFSVVGETILRLKARLWFVHRGIEKIFEGMEARAATPLAERISGDTSVGHGLAFTLAVEEALGIRMPTEGQRLRALLLEMERLYNHIGDIGALANDVGYGIALARATSIRERLLRINESMTGHRLLRDGIRPGQVTLAALPSRRDLNEIAAEVAELAAAILAHNVVLDRFEGTGVLSRSQARDLGCLGYVARSSGLTVDARVDHPFTPLPVAVTSRDTGDVLARYQVRVAEFAASVKLIEGLIAAAGPLEVRARTPRAKAKPTHGLGIVEGWRGTIVHRVEVDVDGRLTRVKVVDPSWFNWPAVPLSMKDTIVPDFPLTNKSFNLSYAGNDL